MRFEYTHNKSVESTALKAVYYNEDTKQLAVQTRYDSVYVYDNVSLPIYNTFINTGSVGNFWATTIKPIYGPSVSARLDEVKFVNTNGLVAADMGTTALGGSTGPHVHHEATVGTPKGLYYADDAVITQRGDEFIPLTTPDSDFPAAVQFEFHVFFTLNGSEKMFGTSAGSVNEALENYRDATAWLDLETKVVRVVQYFV